MSNHGHSVAFTIVNRVYTEEVKLFQPLFKGIYLIAIFTFLWLVATSEPLDPALTIPAVLLLGIPLLFGRMTVTIADDALSINYGYICLLKKNIPLSEIKSAEKVRFRPLRDFGGWGIRCGRFNGERTGCYNLRGDEGVLLHLSRDTRVCIGKTKLVIIGSRHPVRLAEAINVHIETHRGSSASGS